MSELTIRRPVYSDCDGLARVHVASWQAGYRDLMAPEFLAAQDPEVRARQRRDSWHDPDYAHVRGFVAVNGGAVDGDDIVGFVNYGPYRSSHERGWAAVDPNGGGEVYALYVHPDHWGAGVGGTLLDAAVTDLRETGETPVRIWTLVGNDRALRFYQARGFALDGTRQLITLGWGRKLELPEQRLTLTEP
ncbi:MAG: GNAT family N-acetyltransferase [Micromonosporaceae bacterium]